MSHTRPQVCVPHARSQAQQERVRLTIEQRIRPLELAFRAQRVEQTPRV